MSGLLNFTGFIKWELSDNDGGSHYIKFFFGSYLKININWMDGTWRGIGKQMALKMQANQEQQKESTT